MRDFYSQTVFQAALSDRDSGIQRTFQSVVEGGDQLVSRTVLLRCELHYKESSSLEDWPPSPWLPPARVLEKTLAVLNGPEF